MNSILIQDQAPQNQPMTGNTPDRVRSTRRVGIVLVTLSLCVCVVGFLAVWVGSTMKENAAPMPLTLDSDPNLAGLLSRLTSPTPFVATAAAAASELETLPVVYARDTPFPTHAGPTRPVGDALPEAACAEVRDLVLRMAQWLLVKVQSSTAVSAWDARAALRAIATRYGGDREPCSIPLLWHGTTDGQTAGLPDTLLPDPEFTDVWFSPVPLLRFGPVFVALDRLPVPATKIEAWRNRGFVVADGPVHLNGTTAKLVSTVGHAVPAVTQLSFAEACLEGTLVRIARARSSDRATALALGLWNVRERADNCAPRWCLETARTPDHMQRVLASLRRGDLLVSNQGATGGDEWITRDTKLFVALGEGQFRTVAGASSRTRWLNSSDAAASLAIQGWDDWAWAVSGPHADTRRCNALDRTAMLPGHAAGKRLWTHRPQACLATSYSELWGVYTGSEPLETVDLYQAVSNGWFASPPAVANATRAVEWSRTCSSAWKFSRSDAGVAITGSGCVVE